MDDDQMWNDRPVQAFTSGASRAPEPPGQPLSSAPSIDRREDGSRLAALSAQGQGSRPATLTVEGGDDDTPPEFNEMPEEERAALGTLIDSMIPHFRECDVFGSKHQLPKGGATRGWLLRELIASGFNIGALVNFVDFFMSSACQAEKLGGEFRRRRACQIVVNVFRSVFQGCAVPHGAQTRRNLAYARVLIIHWSKFAPFIAHARKTWAMGNAHRHGKLDALEAEHGSRKSGFIVIPYFGETGKSVYIRQSEDVIEPLQKWPPPEPKDLSFILYALAYFHLEHVNAHDGAPWQGSQDDPQRLQADPGCLYGFQDAPAPGVASVILLPLVVFEHGQHPVYRKLVERFCTTLMQLPKLLNSRQGGQMSLTVHQIPQALVGLTASVLNEMQAIARTGAAQGCSFLRFIPDSSVSNTGHKVHQQTEVDCQRVSKDLLGVQGSDPIPDQLLGTYRTTPLTHPKNGSKRLGEVADYRQQVIEMIDDGHGLFQVDIIPGKNMLMHIVEIAREKQNGKREFYTLTADGSIAYKAPLLWNRQWRTLEGADIGFFAKIGQKVVFFLFTHDVGYLTHCYPEAADKAAPLMNEEFYRATALAHHLVMAAVKGQWPGQLNRAFTFDSEDIRDLCRRLTSLSREIGKASLLTDTVSYNSMRDPEAHVWARINPTKNFSERSKNTWRYAYSRHWTSDVHSDISQRINFSIRPTAKGSPSLYFAPVIVPGAQIPADVKSPLFGVKEKRLFDDNPKLTRCWSVQGLMRRHNCLTTSNGCLATNVVQILEFLIQSEAVSRATVRTAYIELLSERRADEGLPDLPTTLFTDAGRLEDVSSGPGGDGTNEIVYEGDEVLPSDLICDTDSNVDMEDVDSDFDMEDVDPLRPPLTFDCPSADENPYLNKEPKKPVLKSADRESCIKVAMRLHRDEDNDKDEAKECVLPNERQLQARGVLLVDSFDWRINVFVTNRFSTEDLDTLMAIVIGAEVVNKLWLDRVIKQDLVPCSLRQDRSEYWLQDESGLSFEQIKERRDCQGPVLRGHNFVFTSGVEDVAVLCKLVKAAGGTATVVEEISAPLQHQLQNNPAVYHLISSEEDRPYVSTNATAWSSELITSALLTQTLELDQNKLPETHRTKRAKPSVAGPDRRLRVGKSWSHLNKDQRRYWKKRGVEPVTAFDWRADVFVPDEDAPDHLTTCDMDTIGAIVLGADIVGSEWWKLIKTCKKKQRPDPLKFLLHDQDHQRFFSTIKERRDATPLLLADHVFYVTTWVEGPLLNLITAAGGRWKHVPYLVPGWQGIPESMMADLQKGKTHFVSCKEDRAQYLLFADQASSKGQTLTEWNSRQIKRILLTHELE